ncbi:MAG TPA: alpha/beta hydrolase [Steroidobacteraceae bacterium]|nr:alpha/beta hydrolase [Steroidobacteraceae bacterium]
MRTLLLLSGLLCDETVWMDAAEDLKSAADVRIASFQGFDSIQAMAEYVLRMAPQQFLVAGHSMGGRVALELFRQAKERVLGLALLNSGVHPLRAGEIESRGRLVKIARERGMSAVAADWLPRMMGASLARVAQVMPKLQAMVERQTVESFAGQTKALLERPDAVPILPTIGVPTLLASGTADTWSPLMQHEEMRRQISEATLVSIEDAGHMAPAEQPHAVAAAMRAWLEQV